MNDRYRLILRKLRGGIFYCVDKITGKRTSLQTTDAAEARQLIAAKNQSHHQPALNMQMAKAYLVACDPAWTERTWQDVMNRIQVQGKDSSKNRCQRALKSPVFDTLRSKKLIGTTADDFLAVIYDKRVSSTHYLRRVHNFALNLGWLAKPVLAPCCWPKRQPKSRRGITLAEHQSILADEHNPERNLYYQLLWEVGAAQSDAASLTHENVDWPTRTLTYFRMKTGEQAQMSISKRLEGILNQLPTEGPLFPTIATTNSRARSAEFCRRCRLLGIKGVSLHSYRYAWAERAKVAGMPERFAQEALGHNSKAVHRAYAKQALVKIPSLQEYEERSAGNT
jgi:integrase